MTHGAAVAAGVHTLAVTVIGPDRPGIVADVTGALAGLGGNLEDCSMTILRGSFAMTLVVAGTVDADAAERALAPDVASGGLAVTVREVEPGAGSGAAGSPFVLSVHGGDRPGIVSGLTRVLARAGGNITDLTTRLSGGLYVLVAEVDLPAGTDADALAGQLSDAARELGVDAVLRPADADLL